MTDVRLEHLLTADVILERLLTADLIFEHLLTTDVILGQFDKFLNRMLIFLLQACASVGGIPFWMQREKLTWNFSPISVTGPTWSNG